MSYELFYSCGGHGGPYWTLEHAIESARARIRGQASLHSVRIVERTADGVGGYGKTVMVIGRTEDDPTPNQMSY